MADEVTKKDLKALQNDYNKQFADVKKKIEALEKTADDDRHAVNTGLEEENKIAVNIRKDFEKRNDEIQTSINALAKAISELATRITKLEKGR